MHYSDNINGRDGVSSHQPHHCLPNRLFRRKSTKTPKLCVIDLCAGNSPVNFPHIWPLKHKNFPFDDVIMRFYSAFATTISQMKVGWSDTFSVRNISGEGTIPYCVLCWTSDVIWRQRSGSSCLRLWLAVWRHRAIKWINVDKSSVRSDGIHMRTISQEMRKISMHGLIFKSPNLRSPPYVQWANKTIGMFP